MDILLWIVGTVIAGYTLLCVVGFTAVVAVFLLFLSDIDKQAKDEDYEEVLVCDEPERS